MKDLLVFPNNNQFHSTFYTDSSIGGNSEIIRQVTTDSIIQIDFELKNGISSPYVGINISPPKDQIVQLAYYNQLDIKVKSANLNNMGITLNSANPYLSSKKQSPEISYYTTLNISSNIQSYSIDLNQFKVPDWWIEMYAAGDISNKKHDLKNISSLNITNAYSPEKGELQSLVIYSVTFSRNNKPLVILLLFLEFGIILLTFFVIYSVEKIRANKKSITITYKPVENSSSNTSKSDFIDFINSNFHNSQLTMELVSRETGVSPRRITNDIQSQFACNFKSYVNRLRINESKRLLLEKELNIGEIAYKVGFNNQSHFNRVFKSELQISPTEFRDK
ncbi:MAG: AraC family transcriptional regulator [Prolixibacteraceae bacterium]